MTILDACVLINLINANVLDVTLKLTKHSFATGPLVKDECIEHGLKIEDAIASRKLELIDDDDIPASVYFEFLQAFELGPGETECLTVAFIRGGYVCTDDRKARRMCERKLGLDWVFGSARLLRESVLAGLLTDSGASSAYETMREHGAFLPRLSIDYFRLPL